MEELLYKKAISQMSKEYSGHLDYIVETLENDQGRRNHIYKREVASLDMIKMFLEEFIKNVSKKDNIIIENNNVVLKGNREQLEILFNSIINCCTTNTSRLFAMKAKQVLFEEIFSNIKTLQINNEKFQFEYIV